MVKDSGASLCLKEAITATQVDLWCLEMDHSIRDFRGNMRPLLAHGNRAGAWRPCTSLSYSHLPLSCCYLPLGEPDWR